MSALAIVALFMTASKGVFIIFSLMILLFPIVYFKGRIEKLMAFGVTILVIFAITVIGGHYLGRTYMIQRMSEVYQSGSNLVRYGSSVRYEEILDPTSVGRITPWVQSWPMIKASPIFGYGPGKSFLRQLGFVAYYREEFEFKNPFESSYLQILFRFGLVGVFINFGLMIHFINLNRRVAAMKDCPKELYRVSSVGVIFGLLLFVIFLNTDCIYNINLMAPVYASAAIAASYFNTRAG
jgi:O-antigen ligase